jgi:hypothetical protein
MSDLLSDDDDAPGAPRRKLFDVAKLVDELRTYYPLFFAILFVFVGVTLAVTLMMKPAYTATALVGPADNSDQPFSEDALGGLGHGGLGGIAKHLHVGGGLGGQTGDKFDEYTSLLTSSRLAAVLVDKDRILPEIFAAQWDAANRRWRPSGGLLAQGINGLKRLLGRTVKPQPDQDDLSKFLATKLKVDTSLETGFATVTFAFASPQEAERILDLILLEADNIIREDKRRDVAARIAYLNSALARLDVADEKEQLIDTLSQQEQEMMMIQSDHRYASLMIDPPHAPRKPSSPLPTIDAAIAVVLSGVAWACAVRFTPQTGRLRNFVELFARRKRKRRRRTAPVAAQAGTG